jgi:hypothetical protein
MAENGNTDWRLIGDGVTSCNCAWGCPCQFNALPTQGFCEAAVAWQIREGHFGDTNLDGVRFAWLLHWPGAIHEGDGHRQVVIDDSVSDEQRQALEALNTGEHGGAGFEIFAAVCPHNRDVISAPIEVESDRERRVASFKIGDIAQTRVEPIRNPVDNTEHRARIDLPEGFEYSIAEMGNTVEATSNAEPPLDLKLENTYAQLNEIDWSPA